jgi:hypothetical protein
VAKARSINRNMALSGGSLPSVVEQESPGAHVQCASRGSARWG